MNEILETDKANQILQAAQKLFWKYGIRKVSVDEICREAGVSRMTFYRLYNNKKELAIKSIDAIFNKWEEKYIAITMKEISFEEKIRETIKLKFEATNDLSEEFVNDILSDWNPEIKKFYGERSASMTEDVMNDYREAIHKGWIRRDVKVEFIFYIVQKMIEYSSDPYLSSLYDGLQEMSMEFMNMLFYGILPRNNE